MQIVEINPFRCRVWNQHPRLDENISEDSCKGEIESFEANGQLVPVLGRRLRRGDTHEIELVYGARRLFVARHLNVPLKVEIRDISDRDAIIALETENRLRKDISPYERGVGYARWLNAGYFSTQQEIAKALQISTSQVCRLLRLARLPEIVVAAFGSAAEVREEWGLALVSLLENDKRKESLLKAAESIASTSPRPPALEVWQQLCAAACLEEAARGANVRLVKDRAGKALFRIKQDAESIVFVLPISRVTRAKLEAIEFALSASLDTRHAEAALPCGIRVIGQAVGHS